MKDLRVERPTSPAARIHLPADAPDRGACRPSDGARAARSQAAAGTKSRATGTGAASRIDSPWGRCGAGRWPRAHAGRWCPCASARARRSALDAGALPYLAGEDQPREKADNGVEGAQQGKERCPRNLPNGEGLVVSAKQRQPSLQVRCHTRCGSRGSRQSTIAAFARRMPRRRLPAVAARHSPYRQKCVATFFNGGLKCAGDGRC